MPDIRTPGTAILYFGLRRDGITELDASIAVEAKVGLFVPPI